MASIFRWIRQATDYAELVDEVFPGETVVEVIGQGRVLIEGHNGISSYDDCEICVNIRLGIAKIAGCNLKLTIMSRNKLVISGVIQHIDFLRRAET